VTGEVGSNDGAIETLGKRGELGAGEGEAMEGKERRPGTEAVNRQLLSDRGPRR
jgi:hypothetical protein